MVLSEELQNIIETLIKSKKEDTYYDFKQEWTDIVSIIRDIISLANCDHEGDKYLIIGVTDTGYLKGVNKQDNKRKTQAKLINALRNANFADGLFPSVSMETITIDNENIDVIIIKNLNEKPYYLEKEYPTDQRKTADEYIPAGTVFTRIKDTNTPKNRVANSNQIEHMWKERFGLTQSVIDRFKIYLSDIENWQRTPEILSQNNDNYTTWFYNKFPEFRVKFSHYSLSENSIIHDNGSIAYMKKIVQDHMGTLTIRGVILEHYNNSIYEDIVLMPNSHCLFLLPSEKMCVFHDIPIKDWNVNVGSACFKYYLHRDIKYYLTTFLVCSGLFSNPIYILNGLATLNNRSLLENTLIKDYSLPFIFFKFEGEVGLFFKYIQAQAPHFKKIMCEKKYSSFIVDRNISSYALMSAYFSYWAHDLYHNDPEWGKTTTTINLHIIFNKLYCQFTLRIYSSKCVNLHL